MEEPVLQESPVAPASSEPLVTPFPYFGSKRDAAPLIWSLLGNCVNYVEPFAGSLAVLLRRPTIPRVETVNDADGLLTNVWRAMRLCPEQVAMHADHPVHEIELHARHLWLVGQRESLTERLIEDLDFCDPKAAGWWIWGASCWIGSGWCSGEGGWSIIDGKFARGDGQVSGVRRKRPDISNDGKGVNKPSVANQGAQGASPPSISKKRPHIGNKGIGVNKPTVSRQMPSLGTDGSGVIHPQRRAILELWFGHLAQRLRNVRVCCGDWSRVVGPSVTWKHLTLSGKLHFGQDDACGVFLDPPYSGLEGYYAKGKKKDKSLPLVAQEVRAWCLENGNNPRLRIVLAGFTGEGHEELEKHGWTVMEWFKSGFLKGGFANIAGSGKTRQYQERLWVSPHCLNPSDAAPLQMRLGLDEENLLSLLGHSL